jgi:hypothetical protein
MAFNYSPKIVTDGLVLYLDAANTKSYVSGSTVWNDISRSGNNGTLINGPTFNSGNGGSIVFDGVNDTTNLGNILNIGLNNLTLSCWVQILNGTGARGIVGKTSLRSFVGRYAIFIESNFIRTLFQPAGTTHVIETPITNYINTGFHNITMVIDRSSFMRLYINNIEVGTPINVSSTSNINLNTSTDIFFVGSYATNTGLLPTLFFNGNIANVQMYHKALTPQEILQNYNATKTRFGL